jgi:hypothetical protein
LGKQKLPVKSLGTHKLYHNITVYVKVIVSDIHS